MIIYLYTFIIRKDYRYIQVLLFLVHPIPPTFTPPFHTVRAAERGPFGRDSNGMEGVGSRWERAVSSLCLAPSSLNSCLVHRPLRYALRSSPLSGSSLDPGHRSPLTLSAHTRPPFPSRLVRFPLLLILRRFGPLTRLRREWNGVE